MRNAARLCVSHTRLLPKASDGQLGGRRHGNTRMGGLELAAYAFPHRFWIASGGYSHHSTGKVGLLPASLKSASQRIASGLAGGVRQFWSEKI